MTASAGEAGPTTRSSATERGKAEWGHHGSKGGGMRLPVRRLRARPLSHRATASGGCRGAGVERANHGGGGGCRGAEVERANHGRRCPARRGSSTSRHGSEFRELPTLKASRGHQREGAGGEDAGVSERTRIAARSGAAGCARMAELARRRARSGVGGGSSGGGRLAPGGVGRKGEAGPAARRTGWRENLAQPPVLEGGRLPMW